MRDLFNMARLLFACTVLFGGGYLFAKPHTNADREFIPVVCVFAVLYLWRRGKATPSGGISF